MGARIFYPILLGIVMLFDANMYDLTVSNLYVSIDRRTWREFKSNENPNPQKCKKCNDWTYISVKMKEIYQESCSVKLKN